MLPVVRRWAPALALVALAGLFAMHGMGDHTATHAELPGTSDHHTMAMTRAAPAEGGSAAAPSTPVGEAGAMALCSAVLAGGALALAWLALRGRTAAPWRRTAWPAERLPRSRDPDPPRPLLLGVCRC